MWLPSAPCGRGARKRALSSIAAELQAAPGDDDLPPGPPRHTSARTRVTKALVVVPRAQLPRTRVSLPATYPRKRGLVVYVAVVSLQRSMLSPYLILSHLKRKAAGSFRDPPRKTTHTSSRGLVVGGTATSLRVPPVVRLGRLERRGGRAGDAALSAQRRVPDGVRPRVTREARSGCVEATRWLSVLSCGSVCRSCVTVTARPPRPPIPRWCPSRWSDCVSPSHQSIVRVAEAAQAPLGVCAEVV